MSLLNEYGIEPSAYRVPVERYVQIVQRDENAWAIVDAGCCLNSYGEWEVEPMSSNRTDAFKMRTRWPLEDAARRAVEHFNLTRM